MPTPSKFKSFTGVMHGKSHDVWYPYFNGTLPAIHKTFAAVTGEEVEPMITIKYAFAILETKSKTHPDAYCPHVHWFIHTTEPTTRKSVTDALRLHYHTTNAIHYKIRALGRDSLGSAAVQYFSKYQEDAETLATIRDTLQASHAATPWSPHPDDLQTLRKLEQEAEITRARIRGKVSEQHRTLIRDVTSVPTSSSFTITRTTKAQTLFDLGPDVQEFTIEADVLELADFCGVLADGCIKGYPITRLNRLPAQFFLKEWKKQQSDANIKKRTEEAPPAIGPFDKEDKTDKPTQLEDLYPKGIFLRDRCAILERIGGSKYFCEGTEYSTLVTRNLGDIREHGYWEDDKWIVEFAFDNKKLNAEQQKLRLIDQELGKCLTPHGRKKRKLEKAEH